MALVPHKEDPDYKHYKKGGLELLAKKRTTSPERSLPKNTQGTGEGAGSGDAGGEVSKEGSK